MQYVMALFEVLLFYLDCINNLNKCEGILIIERYLIKFADDFNRKAQQRSGNNV